MKRLLNFLVLAAGLAAPTFGAPVVPLAPWLESTAPAIVRVRIVLEASYSMGGQSEKQEFTTEAFAAVVDPNGLLLLSNSNLSASRAKDMMGAYGQDPGDLGWNITPLSFNVVEADGTERPAALVATDSDLDLAFLHLEETPASPLVSVAFAAATPVAIGDELRILGRFGASFGHAPWVAWGRIAGRIDTPRAAWVVDATDGVLGLPVFDTSGRAVGILTTLFAKSASQEEPPFGFASMMNQFAGRGSDTGPVGTFLLPVDASERLVARARAQAVRVLAEGRAQQEAAAAAEAAAEPAPAADDPPAPADPPTP